MTARQQALEFFIRQGWTPQQAAGIVANLEAESGLRPDAVGDGGAAHGLAQWHQPRPRRGESITGSTFEQQLQYVEDELRAHSGATDESRAAFLLAQCDTAARSAAVFCEHYERPADIPGESAKRGALAERIYADYGGTSGVADGTPMPPSPPPSPDAAATPQPPEKPMGALLLPLLMSVVSKFTNPEVAQNVTSIIAKDGGQGTAAQNLIGMLLNAVASGAGTTAGAMKADEATAIKAVATVQSDADKLKAVEDAAAAHLANVMPYVKELAVLDQMRYDAEVKGKQAVSTVAIEEHKAGLWDMTQTVVYIAGGMLSVITIGLLAALVYEAGWKGAIDPGLLGLSGPILMATVTAWAAIIAYRFDGSKESHAAAEAQRATERYREETGKA